MDYLNSMVSVVNDDYNTAGACSSEQALMVIRKRDLDMDVIEVQFWRTVFNIIGRNQDNHVNNIAFLMDDFCACAKAASMKRGRAEQIIEEVEKVLCNRQDHAVAAGVSSQWREKRQNALLLNYF